MDEDPKDEEPKRPELDEPNRLPLELTFLGLKRDLRGGLDVVVVCWKVLPLLGSLDLLLNLDLDRPELPEFCLTVLVLPLAVEELLLEDEEGLELTCLRFLTTWLLTLESGELE